MFIASTLIEGAIVIVLLVFHYQHHLTAQKNVASIGVMEQEISQKIYGR